PSPALRGEGLISKHRAPGKSPSLGSLLTMRSGFCPGRGPSARHHPAQKKKRPGTHVRGRRLKTGPWLRGVLVPVGGDALAARQREGLALIERADAALVEAGLLDLQVSTVQRIRRQLLDSEADGFGRSAKSPIGKARPFLLANGGGKKFGGGVEVE